MGHSVSCESALAAVQNARYVSAVPRPIVVTRIESQAPEENYPRVAAYIRVSTRDPSQQDSLWTQRNRFTRLITSNPAYAFAGVFCDDGVSGHRADRPALGELMRAARAGRVDLVFTKSISRFARNTELLLKTVRELQSLRVGVIFDEQNIDTRTIDGEVLMTMLGAVAEAERAGVSGNVRWSMAKRIENGRCDKSVRRLYGYSQTDGGLIPNERAEIVREIYARYLGGGSGLTIARDLNARAIPSPAGGAWSQSSVNAILSHEKYKGDALLFKQRRLAHGGVIYNRGQHDRYYLEGDHPAIISEETWEAVQALKKERLTAGRGALSGRLKCPFCGTSLTRVVAKGRVFWCCRKSLREGRRACAGIRVPEDAVPRLREERCYTVYEGIRGEGMIAAARVHGHDKTYCFMPAPPSHC